MLLALPWPILLRLKYREAQLHDGCRTKEAGYVCHGKHLVISFLAYCGARWPTPSHMVPVIKCDSLSICTNHSLKQNGRCKN
jgi:hypothetical protein